MTITSSLRFLYIFGGSGLLCAAAATRPRLRRTKQRRPLWVRHPSEAPSRQATPVSAAVTATESQLDKRSKTAKNKIQKIREIDGSYS